MVQEFDGYWWLPGRRAQQKAGRLTISEDSSLQLDLLGSWDPLAPFQGALPHYPLIHGVTNDHKLFTLEDCVAVRATAGTPHGETVSLKPLWGYQGSHLGHTALRFTEMTVCFDVLADWYGVSGLTGRHREGSRGWSLLYQPPSPRVFRIQPWVTLTLKTGFSEQRAPRQWSFEESAWLVVQSRHALTIREWLQGYVEPLRDFFSLAAGRAATIRTVEVASSRTLTRMVDGSTRRIPVGVFFKRRPPAASGRTAARLLFYFSDVAACLDSVWTNWLKCSEEVRPVVNLYFATLDSPDAYLEWHFLSMAQALETYHRVRIGGEELEQEQHSRRICAILRSVSSEHAAWLRQKLRWSNELSFAERLRQLVVTVGAVVPDILGDSKRLVRHIVDTRNYLVHYDESTSPRPTDSEDLYWLQQRCAYLVQACLMRELGVGDEQVKALFARSPSYQFTCGHA